MLLALLIAEGESNLILEGGTHNPLAPPLDFSTQAFLPLLNRWNCAFEAQLLRRILSGRWRAVHGPGVTRPATRPCRTHRARRDHRPAHPRLVADLPRHIAECECRTIARKTGWEEDCFAVEEVPDSPGRATC